MPLCTVCKVQFDTPDEFRTHFASTWHKYNLKRAEKGKNVLTRERFAQMQALAGQEKFTPKKADHIKPKAEEEPREKKPRVPKHTDKGRDYDLTFSLFDDKVFSTMQESLNYMEEHFRFTLPRFLPNLEFEGRKFWSVKDPKWESDEEDDEEGTRTVQSPVDYPLDTTNAEGAEGEEMESEDEEDDEYARIRIISNGHNVKVNGKYALLYYLGSIIWRARECLFCDKSFVDPVAVQNHMAACSHQKMNHSMEGEVQDFYNWPSWLEWLQTKYFSTPMGQKHKEIEGEDAEATIEEMLQVIGTYHAEDGERLMVGGGAKVLQSRRNVKQLNSRALSSDTLALAHAATEKRRTMAAIGMGDDADLAHKKKQALLVQRNKIQKHDYRLQFRSHRIHNIQNMQIAYMMNSTGH